MKKQRFCWDCGAAYRLRGEKQGPFKEFNDEERIWRGAEPFCTLRCALNYARGTYDAHGLDTDYYTQSAANLTESA
jgi:hypothetical protein